MKPPTLVGARVRLRPWRKADLKGFAKINADADVMRHFPAPLSREQSDGFAASISERFALNGYGLWALQVPGIAFAGFVGLMPALRFEFEFAEVLHPPTEIGWRLARAAWGQGYASEAARLVLQFAWAHTQLAQLVSFTAQSNQASQAVMQRIGMRWLGEFAHPRIELGHPLRPHVLYVIDRP